MEIKLSALQKYVEASAGLVLDAREDFEYEESHIPGALNLPLEELRSRLDELRKDHPIWLVCAVGQRAYYANRALLQHGYDVRILSGGMQTYATFARETG